MKIIKSPLFNAASYYKGKPKLEEYVLDVLDAIATGQPLPHWAYRRDIDTTPDEVLNRYGMMHLHLGSQGSNELLWVMQYEDRVIVLAIGNHNNFAGMPKGELLYRFHKAKVAELNEAYAREKLAAEALRDKPKITASATQVKAGLLPRKPKTS
ncbi:hypothetical protein [Allorhizobium taibaishanense]|uniref:hypothetical protein n=1 Tax=Allorhizobium taibaishanense TaxID=887144 RepID=UPI001AEE0556|nr:hypothetical protein [Allorhizobium taibaishanense]